MFHLRKQLALTITLVLMILVVSTHAQDPDTPPIITADNVDQLTEITQLGQGDSLDMAWSPDGEWLAIGGEQGIWLYSNSLELESAIQLDGATEYLDWLGDGQTLITYAEQTFTLWDIETESATDTFSTQFSFDDKFLLSPDRSQVAGIVENEIHIIDVPSGELVTRYVAHDIPIEAFVWLSNNAIVSSDEFAHMRYWNPQTGEDIRPIYWELTIYLMELSPDESRMLFNMPMGILAFADAELTELGDHIFVERGQVVDMEFSPDGSLVGAINHEYTLLFWNIESDDEIPMAKFEIEPPSDDIEILQFEWSPDGTLVAANVDGTVHLWGIPLT